MSCSNGPSAQNVGGIAFPDDGKVPSPLPEGRLTITFFHELGIVRYIGCAGPFKTVPQIFYVEPVPVDCLTELRRIAGSAFVNNQLRHAVQAFGKRHPVSQIVKSDKQGGVRDKGDKKGRRGNQQGEFGEKGFFFHEKIVGTTLTCPLFPATHHPVCE